MNVRFAHQKEIDSWNSLILANPDNGNIFQGYEFAEQKRQNDWKPRFIVAGNTAITALEKSVPFLGKFWYLPKGPGISRVRELDDLVKPLEQFAASHGVFAIKIEPELRRNDEVLADLMKLGLRKVRPIQPNFSTVLVDISPNLDEVLARFNQKGRHAIRRAERDGVIVREVDSSDENCQKMYELLAKTAAGSFSIRSYDYYKTFWQRYAAAHLGQLFFAYVDQEIVAGAYAIAFGKKGTYKDGASVRERPVYGASHLLQWHVIKWMKKKGVTIHDLCGAPPSDQINNTNHPHYGIGRFKTSFNKEVTDYVGAYDLVIKPLPYVVWEKIGERLVLRVHRQLHHESWY